jgi:hypothetical protein
MDTITPHTREMSDFIFFGFENSIKGKKKLHENFFGMIPSFEKFLALYDFVTQDKRFLVLDNTEAKASIQDQIFYYKPHSIESYDRSSFIVGAFPKNPFYVYERHFSLPTDTFRKKIIRRKVNNIFGYNKSPSHRSSKAFAKSSKSSSSGSGSSGGSSSGGGGGGNIGPLALATSSGEEFILQAPPPQSQNLPLISSSPVLPTESSLAEEEERLLAERRSPPRRSLVSTRRVIQL